ncbi:hypothetical protein COT97_02515 [Candidatus Falkowbacteria bacterium CG10_big_fil_rev_8_21_14_0_10_39_11]|uniref:Uncharacterized protein n=1 Tax=Candidatus Falkowbacteria bacterium CG10_big_fil_rev_8_21_14_0_10_39_11 TaxID=1974565 RepID=A0A2H0V560_9BACT|nr:MAG: hypothetical protein COT97_02515 [Candidatus Falkowbacteria bacterium CG10_big_fil_rev_8_21_14_0_10_39_11]
MPIIRIRNIRALRRYFEVRDFQPNLIKAILAALDYFGSSLSEIDLDQRKQEFLARFSFGYCFQVHEDTLITQKLIDAIVNLLQSPIHSDDTRVSLCGSGKAVCVETLRQKAVDTMMIFRAGSFV